MLQTFKDKLTGWVAWLIAIAIAVAFTLWGFDISSFRRQAESEPLLTVAGETIHRQDIEPLYHQLRQQWFAGQEQLPDVLEQQLRQHALDRWSQWLLVRRAGLTVSEDQLQKVISAIGSEFKENGQFSQSRFVSYLRQQGYQSVGQLAQLLRLQIAAEQLKQGLHQSTWVPSAELKDTARLLAQTRHFHYAIVAATSFQDEIAISDQAIQSYYDQHAAQFTEPEQVRISYLALRLQDLIKNIDVDESAIGQYHQQHLSQYTTPPKWQVAHIWLSTDAKRSQEQTQYLANDLVTQLRSGQDFATTAKKQSNDPITAPKGGLLSSAEPFLWPEPLAKVLQSLAVDQISDPISVPGGYHILKLMAVQPETIRPIEEVRSSIAQQLRWSQANHQYAQQLEELADLTFVNPDSLQVAAKALGLNIKTTPWLNRDNLRQVLPNDLQKPAVLDAIFSSELLNSRQNSSVLPLGADASLVVRITAHRPKRQQALSEVREQIIERLKQQQAQQRAQQEGQRLLQSLQQGQPRQDKSHVTWKTIQAMSRVQPPKNLDPTIIKQVFQLTKPSQNQPVYFGGAVPKGYLLIQLDRVNEPEPSDEVIQQAQDALQWYHADGAHRIFLELMAAQPQVASWF